MGHETSLARLGNASQARDEGSTPFARSKQISHNLLLTLYPERSSLYPSFSYCGFVEFDKKIEAILSTFAILPRRNFRPDSGIPPRFGMFAP